MKSSFSNKILCQVSLFVLFSCLVINPVLATCGLSNDEISLLNSIASEANVSASLLINLIDRTCYNDTFVKQNITALQNDVNVLNNEIGNVTFNVTDHYTKSESDYKLNVTKDVILSKFVDYPTRTELNAVSNYTNISITWLVAGYLNNHTSWVENQTGMLQHLENIYSVINLTENWRGDLEDFNESLRQEFDDVWDEFSDTEKVFITQGKLNARANLLEKLINDSIAKVNQTTIVETNVDLMDIVRANWIIFAVLGAVIVGGIWWYTKNSDMQNKLKNLPLIRDPKRYGRGTVEDMGLKTRPKTQIPDLPPPQREVQIEDEPNDPNEEVYDPYVPEPRQKPKPRPATRKRTPKKKVTRKRKRK